MDVSVIIVNYKTVQLTIESISSVRRFTENVSYEIIVVDNNSEDGSVEQLKSLSDIILIENEKNIGFGQANNKGAAIAKGRYIFLLNSDAFLTNNALAIFRDFMDLSFNAAVCGGALITGRSDQTASYGNLPTLMSSISEAGFFIFYKKYYKKYLASGVVNETDDIKKVGYVNGADMFIRKSLFDKVGQFDGDFFIYFEETELSSRFSKMGFDSFILPAVIIIHLVGGSQKTKSFNYFNYTQFFKSKNLYFIKVKGNFYALLVKFVTITNEILFHILLKRKGNLIKKLRILFRY